MTEYTLDYIKQHAAEISTNSDNLGHEAGLQHTPTPMSVGGYTVDDGVCGFAWIWFVANTPANKMFLNGLKKAGLVQTDPNSFESKPWAKRYMSPGYTFWISDHNQSMERKRAHANTMAVTLREYGITCHSGSRMD